MRVLIAGVGRLKNGPERALAERYAIRAGQTGRAVAIGPVEVVEIPESRARRPADRMREEAASLRIAIGNAHAIALDEQGRSPTSADFAARLGALRDEGASALAFVIGGADGLDRDFLAGCRARIAFGAMTWPHQIVRVLLAEQIYRATTILAGHPYHRE